jgi:hypothetical protein
VTDGTTQSGRLFGQPICMVIWDNDEELIKGVGRVELKDDRRCCRYLAGRLTARPRKRPGNEFSGYASRSIAAVQVFAQLVTALGRPALTRLQGLDQVLSRSKQPPVFRLAEQ